MKKNLTLLVLAAGMGSRFGGLKQIEPIGPNGEFITDYSAYDALLNGFSKIVFIIKRENLEIFRNTIGNRIGDKIPVDYAFQENYIEYNGEKLTREKPWGTAHAIMCAKDKIDGDFVVINSDDFYGRDAYKVASEFFANQDIYDAGVVGYRVINTLTENGSVKRGICESQGSDLTDIIESKVNKENGLIIASPLSGGENFTIDEDTLVSMNMLLFNKSIFDLIDQYKDQFISDNYEKLDTFEYLIPEVLRMALKNKKIKIKLLETKAKWEGVTYKEDKEGVVKAIKALIDSGLYNEDLWK